MGMADRARQCLLFAVDLDVRSAWTEQTKEILKRWDDLVAEVDTEKRATDEKDTPRRLLVAFHGERLGRERERESTSRKGDDVRRILTALYEAVAGVRPTADVIPLFEFCGWTRESIMQYWRSPCIVTNDTLLGLSSQNLVGKRESRKLACEAEPADPEECCNPCSQMNHVCVGGTFDRLHAGHRLLLAVTVATCKQTIYLGITSEALLSKKRNRELLESFESRREHVVEFIRSMNPSLQVAVGVLDDVSCAPMPKQFIIQVASGELGEQKPQAVTSEGMEGIVVSRETVAGATWINDERKTLGYKPLSVVAVNLVGAISQMANAKKLSSSDLREMDARNKKIKQ